MYQPMPINDSNRMNFSLVRIYDAEKQHVVGGGFLVTYWQIVTCAHVVAEATGLPVPITGNNVYVWIDFPFFPNSPQIKARVEAPWPADSGYDIARLYPESYIQGSMPVPLCMTQFTGSDQSITCIGFPGRMKDGLTVGGTISQRNAKYWYQIDNTDITHGFSGCPVWHKQLGGVVGMVVSKVDNLNKGVAFLIPTRMLMQLWPEFPMVWNGDNPIYPPMGRLIAQDNCIYHCYIDQQGQLQYI